MNELSKEEIQHLMKYHVPVCPKQNSIVRRIQEKLFRQLKELEELQDRSLEVKNWGVNGEDVEETFREYGRRMKEEIDLEPFNKLRLAHHRSESPIGKKKRFWLFGG